MSMRSKLLGEDNSSGAIQQHSMFGMPLHGLG